ncbi:MAG: formylglycine-generating enzyme family protein [Chitinophagales bacterium]
MNKFFFLLLIIMFSCKSKSIEKYNTWNDFNDVQIQSINAISANKTPDISDMVLIKADSFIMGNDFGYKNEAPAHKVILNAFYIDKMEVSNADFTKFIKATNYKTTAEKNYTVGEAFFEAGSFVFQEKEDNWWHFVKNISWKNYSDGTLPVVHVSWYDATAYCQWKNKRLPTEAEWEYTAKQLYSNTIISQNRANTWQGNFPLRNDTSDGFYNAAPVNLFKSDTLDIYNLYGNVWEWCADNYTEDYYSTAPLKNPINTSNYYAEKTMRGGSFLCNDSYCSGYRPTARMFATPNSTFEHVGFRCACNAE